LVLRSQAEPLPRSDDNHHLDDRYHYWVTTPKRLNREQKKARTRAALIEAASKLFATRGYHAASVADVADAAGYSHGAVYSNFESKEELFLAGYEEYAARRTQEIRQAFASGGPRLSDKAAVAGDQWMARFAREPHLFLLQIEFAAHAARNPALRRSFANREAAVPEAIARLLKDQAETEGLELAFPPQTMATLLRGLGNGLALEQINDRDAVPPQLFGDFMAWLFEAMATVRPQDLVGRRR
jgi:AcrR family transcriptional regulator